MFHFFMEIRDNNLFFKIDGITCGYPLLDTHPYFMAKDCLKACARRLMFEISKELKLPIHEVKFEIVLCDEIENHNFGGKWEGKCMSYKK